MKMKKYEVSVPVSGYEYYLVEAESKKQAIGYVEEGLCDMHDSDIHQTLDNNEYEAKEVE